MILSKDELKSLLRVTNARDIYGRKWTCTVLFDRGRAVASDGARLYVIASDEEESDVYAIDADALKPIAIAARKHEPIVFRLMEDESGRDSVRVECGAAQWVLAPKSRASVGWPASVDDILKVRRSGRTIRFGVNPDYLADLLAAAKAAGAGPKQAVVLTVSDRLEAIEASTRNGRWRAALMPMRLSPSELCESCPEDGRNRCGAPATQTLARDEQSPPYRYCDRCAEDAIETGLYERVEE